MSSRTLSISVTTRLSGKVVLITGATGEIGSATAVEFAREGAAGIALHYNRNRSQAAKLGLRIKAMGCRSVSIRTDLSNPTDAKKLVAETVSRLGRLDLLVCLAGHPFSRGDWFERFERLTPEQLKKPIEVDLLGSAYVVQAAIPIMRRQRGGKIVLIGSTPALTGDSVGTTYLIAKAGLLALTRSLAQYLGKDNIHVNALALGAIDTESTLGHLKPKEKSRLAREASLRRFGSPMEVARKIVFLSSGDSDFLTGQTIVVDGGYAMR